MAMVGAASYISRFTRFAGEAFGALIAILFFQQAIKGLIHEFSTNPDGVDQAWMLVNGTWSLFLAWGMLLSGLLVRQARHWRFLTASIRSILTDYGPPLAVLFWTGLSYAVGGPAGVPARVVTPNTWEVKSSWLTSSNMADVPGKYIAAAMIPAFVVTVLFFFDHNVSSQLAQAPEFGLRKPPAYHWDMFLLGEGCFIVFLITLLM